jgi:hypothetical protein
LSDCAPFNLGTDTSVIPKADAGLALSRDVARRILWFHPTIPVPYDLPNTAFFMLKIFENRVNPEMLLTGYSQISCRHHPKKNYSISIGVSNRKTTLFPECFMQNQCLFLPDDDSSIGFESSVSGSPRSKRPWAR